MLHPTEHGYEGLKALLRSTNQPMSWAVRDLWFLLKTEREKPEVLEWLANNAQYFDPAMPDLHMREDHLKELVWEWLQTNVDEFPEDKRHYLLIALGQIQGVDEESGDA
jgi:hypothetical protein